MKSEEKKPSFIRRFFGWMWRNKWWIIILLLIAGGLCWWLCPKVSSKKKDYVTVDIVRGDVIQFRMKR